MNQCATGPEQGQIEVILVKLGGSLITDKRREATARPAVIARLAREVAKARPGLEEQLILGHGSGSFGHMAAARHGLGKGPYTPPAALGEHHRLRGIAETLDQAAQLHRLMISALLEAGEVPFAWAPSAALAGRAGRPAEGGRIDSLLGALALGLLPVVYGDVVLDRLWGASIFSTEVVVQYLVGRLQRRNIRVKRLLWCGETDGLYDAEGNTIEVISRTNFHHARAQIGATAGTDVTGGMHLRLETTRSLAQKGIESWLINGTTPGLLEAALRGEAVPGTRVVGWSATAEYSS